MSFRSYFRDFPWFFVGTILGIFFICVVIYMMATSAG